MLLHLKASIPGCRGTPAIATNRAQGVVGFGAASKGGLWNRAQQEERVPVRFRFFLEGFVARTWLNASMLPLTAWLQESCRTQGRHGSFRIVRQLKRQSKQEKKKEKNRTLNRTAGVRAGLVVGCACLFAGYGLADRCQDPSIPFVLGHASTAARPRTIRSRAVAGGSRSTGVGVAAGAGGLALFRPDGTWNERAWAEAAIEAARAELRGPA